MSIDPTKAIQKVFTGVKGSTAKTNGPADKYRDKKPEQYDQAEWEQLINEVNADYKKGANKAAWDRDGKHSSEISRYTIDDIVAAGKRSGTLKHDANQTKRQDTATEIAGDARARNNADTQRLAGVDVETYNANQRSEDALATLKGEKAAASAGFHKTAGDVRQHAKDANKEERGALQGLGEDYSKLNLQDQNALADYLSATDPMMKEIFARTSDPADIQRQLDAYAEQKGAVDKYKELSDPAVTGKERYLSELARREFEAGDKSNREAVSEQLANRGLRSGGQQIAMQQSTQQGLSQDRLLKELGIQAGAVDRSMKAMEGYSTASGRLGVQSNAIRDANDSQRQYEDNFRVAEATRISGLAGDRKGKSDTTTKTVGERDKGYYDADAAYAGNSFARNTKGDQADWDATAKDYGMAGDYYNADTGTGATRIERAVGGANLAERLGVTGHNRVANALAVQTNVDDNEEERDVVGL